MCEPALLNELPRGYTCITYKILVVEFVNVLPTSMVHHQRLREEGLATRTNHSICS